MRVNRDSNDANAHAINRSSATEIVGSDDDVDGHRLAPFDTVRSGQHFPRADKYTAAELIIEEVI
jgi:hypothetical protein